MNNPLFPRTPNLHGATVPGLRAQLRDYFISTFNRYESLFETLASDDAFYVKPISLRHPLIFYYGHTATFFINKLLLARLINERINPRFESMFAVGVDEMSWDDLDSKNYAWPKVAEVKAYRDQVRELVLALIDTAPMTLPVDWHNPWWAIIMGVEHERIHLETSSVLTRQHHLSRVQPHPSWRPCIQAGPALQNSLVEIPPGVVELNKSKTDAYYGWDNEYGYHHAEIGSFKAAKFLVSNGEFLEFVQAGGYDHNKYWEEEGCAWREYARAVHPTFWVKHQNTWFLRLMTEEVPMRWDWPVEVNYHEAKAFCNWKKMITGQNYRLPTEDEWYRLCDFSGIQEVGGEIATANIHLDYFASSCPVNRFAQGDLYDVTGNVWQWTETPIYPFDGFEVHPIYDDFTTPTFDNRHNLIKGGSWISCGNESLRSARYAFRRHFFQHAGFRYVIAQEIKPMPGSHYETDRLMSEYAEFHYGDRYFDVNNFPKTLAEIALAAMAEAPKHSALDLGCASGRATFELARVFDKVTGVDFSARFIAQGVRLAQTGILRYTLADEGELVSYKSRSLAELELAEVAQKVEFFQGDACNLKPLLTGYDLVLAANLIDRLYDPKKFLRQIHERLNLGGVLLIASPYTWLAEHTPREDWLGGFKKDGESYTTQDALRDILAPHFRLIGTPQDVPFVIRETRRKFQHSVSEVTLWQRIQ